MGLARPKHKTGRRCLITFGERLRAVRLKRGLSQYRLAKDADVSQAIIHRLESGKRSDDGRLTMQVVVKLAKALHVRTDYLCGLEEDLPAKPASEDQREGMPSEAVLCAQCAGTVETF